MSVGVVLLVDKGYLYAGPVRTNRSPRRMSKNEQGDVRKFNYQKLSNCRATIEHTFAYVELCIVCCI